MVFYPDVMLHFSVLCYGGSMCEFLVTMEAAKWFFIRVLHFQVVSIRESLVTLEAAE